MIKHFIQQNDSMVCKSEQRKNDFGVNMIDSWGNGIKLLEIDSDKVKGKIEEIEQQYAML